MDLPLSMSALNIGVILAASGGIIVGIAKGVPSKLWTIFIRRFTRDIRVLDTDPLYWDMQAWLHTKVEKFRSYDAATKYIPDENGTLRRKVVLGAGLGRHIIKHDKKRILLSRIEEKGGSDEGLGGTSSHRNTIVLRCLGRKPDALRSLLIKARKFSNPDEEMVQIHSPQGYHGWSALGPVEPREPSQVSLKEGQWEGIEADVARFRNSREDYRRKGIPYKRGYLFYGPPGSGKTTTIRTMATHFKMPIYTINVSSFSGGDSAFGIMMSQIPRGALLVLEDIDCAKLRRRGEKVKQQADAKEKILGVTLSGLLNAFDGLYSQSGTVMVLTTNYREDIDPALLRPGRIDKELLMDNADEYQIRDIAKRFFPEASSDDVNRLASKWGDSTRSMAEVQGDLMTMEKI